MISATAPAAHGDDIDVPFISWLYCMCTHTHTHTITHMKKQDCETQPKHGSGTNFEGGGGHGGDGAARGNHTHSHTPIRRRPSAAPCVEVFVQIARDTVTGGRSVVALTLTLALTSHFHSYTLSLSHSPLSPSLSAAVPLFRHRFVDIRTDAHRSVTCRDGRVHCGKCGARVTGARQKHTPFTCQSDQSIEQRASLSLSLSFNLPLPSFLLSLSP